jgi:hypothetical protein
MSFRRTIFECLRKNFGEEKALRLLNKIKADLEASKTERELSSDKTVWKVKTPKDNN